MTHTLHPMFLNLLLFATCLFPQVLVQSGAKRADTRQANGSGWPMSFSMRVEVAEKVALSAKRDGFIESSELTLGRSVQCGATVVSLESQLVRLEVERLAAEVERLTAKLSDKSEFNKAKNNMNLLLRRKSGLESANETAAYFANEKDWGVSEIEIEELETELKNCGEDLAKAEAEIRQAEAELNAKKAELAVARSMFAYSSIQAPFDGIVFSRFKFNGEAVQKGEAIAELYNLEKLQGVILVNTRQTSAEEFRRLVQQSNLKAKFPLGDNYESTAFDIKLVSLIPRIMSERAQFICEFKNRKINGNWQIMPGMKGKLYLTPAVEKQAMK